MDKGETVRVILASIYTVRRPKAFEKVASADTFLRGERKAERPDTLLTQISSKCLGPNFEAKAASTNYPRTGIPLACERTYLGVTFITAPVATVPYSMSLAQ